MPELRLPRGSDCLKLPESWHAWLYTSRPCISHTDTTPAAGVRPVALRVRVEVKGLGETVKGESDLNETGPMP